MAFGGGVDAIPEQIIIRIHIFALRWHINVGKAVGGRVGKHRFDQAVHVHAHNVDARMMVIEGGDGCKAVRVIRLESWLSPALSKGPRASPSGVSPSGGMLSQRKSPPPSA